MLYITRNVCRTYLTPTLIFSTGTAYKGTRPPRSNKRVITTRGRFFLGSLAFSTQSLSLLSLFSHRFVGVLRIARIIPSSRSIGPGCKACCRRGYILTSNVVRPIPHPCSLLNPGTLRQSIDALLGGTAISTTNKHHGSLFQAMLPHRLPSCRHLCRYFRAPTSFVLTVELWV
jgi:hypothetical protein